MDILPAMTHVSSQVALSQNLDFIVPLEQCRFFEHQLFVLGRSLSRLDNVILLHIALVQELHIGVSMILADSFCDLFVLIGLSLIDDQENQIETRQQRVWHSDVLADCKVLLVFAVERVRGSNH